MGIKGEKKKQVQAAAAKLPAKGKLSGAAQDKAKKIISASQEKKQGSRPSGTKTQSKMSAPPAAGHGSGQGKHASWIAIGIIIILALVSMEMVFMMKGKVSRQAIMNKVGTFGTRGDADLPQAFKGTGIQKVDAYGRYFLVDPDRNKVVVYNSQDGTFIMALDRVKAKKEDFVPRDVEADDKYIYILDNNASISVFSNQGELVQRWSAPNSRSICRDGKGNLLVTNLEFMQIERRTPQGQKLDSFGGRGQAKGKLDNPGRMDIDAQGNLYVLDMGNQRAQSYTSQGKFLRNWRLKFNPDPLTNLAVWRDEIFINDFSHHTIWVYSTHGQLVKELHIGYPGAVAVDAEGFLYLPGPEGIDRFSISAKE